MGDAALPGTWVSYLGKKWRFGKMRKLPFFVLPKEFLGAQLQQLVGGEGKRGAGTSISESQTGGVFKTGFVMHRQITNTNTDINYNKNTKYWRRGSNLTLRISDWCIFPDTVLLLLF